MVEAVAKTDKRLLLLVQYTGSMGYTINGIGYEKRGVRAKYKLHLIWKELKKLVILIRKTHKK